MAGGRRLALAEATACLALSVLHPVPHQEGRKRKHDGEEDPVEHLRHGTVLLSVRLQFYRRRGSKFPTAGPHRSPARFPAPVGPPRRVKPGFTLSGDVSGSVSPGGMHDARFTAGRDCVAKHRPSARPSGASRSRAGGGRGTGAAVHPNPAVVGRRRGARSPGSAVGAAAGACACGDRIRLYRLPRRVEARRRAGARSASGSRREPHRPNRG